MKIALPALIFLFSIAAFAGANRYDDGSYYNDDYISAEDPVSSTKVELPPIIYAPRIIRTPRKIVRPIIKKRRPANTFQEVHAGGRMNGFKDVTIEGAGPGSNDSDSSLGSK